MTKSLLSTTALALAIAFPATAAAQQAPQSPPPSSCPPGSWFCAEAPQQQAAPAGEPVQPLKPLPDPEQPPPSPRRPAPPVVVYQPPPAPDMWRPEMPPPYEYPPVRREPLLPSHEWGLNARLEGLMIGRGSAGNASMGGAGAGLRYKPTRTLGIEADFDFVGGTDYQGNRRSERAFSLNGLLFLNPKSRAQIYLIAGFGWAGPSVQNDAQSSQASYAYFGGQAGGGLELRLSRSLALNADLRGFLRSRTDALASTQPEFIDQNGRSTNTSAGALLTGGMTLYF
jgi:hypothetical protein